MRSNGCLGALATAFEGYGAGRCFSADVKDTFTRDLTEAINNFVVERTAATRDEQKLWKYSVQKCRLCPPQASISSYHILHNTNPPRPLSTHSLASKTPLSSVLTAIISPT